MNQLEHALRGNDACIPLERLDAPLTDRERQHVAGCARCQAELALWEELRDAAPPPGEEAAVQWIAGELRRRRAGRQPAGVPTRMLSMVRARPTLALAASLVLVAGLMFAQWDREPAVSGRQSEANEYRGTRLDVVGPAGDLEKVPEYLEWVAFSGAERYDVTILEVDRTVVWRGVSTATRLVLPAVVAARLTPGKALQWEVRAVDRHGAAVASSAMQRFRLPPRS
jgi:hypothetical protein